MLARAQAARELIASGEVDPALALSHVVWPDRTLAELSATVSRPTPRPDELRQRALELVSAGLSQAAAGAAIGVPRTTIQLWVRQLRLAS
jgi:Homeodomain-like domain-containing protein